MTPPMVIRQQAVEACIERFNGKPMKWGTVDCARIVSHNLRHLGVSTSLLKGLTYSSEHAALKAMRSLGVEGLGGAMDLVGDRVFRIPPAAAVQGDIIGMATEGEVWDMALTVAVGNGRVLGILNGKAVVMQPDLTQAVAAWRCNPCRR
jgi:hypothetical protein